MLQLTGGSIGLGLTTAVFASAFHSTVHKALSGAQAHAVNGILGNASTATLMRHFPSTAHVLDRVSRDAFATAMHSGFRLTAALGAAGFLVALGFIGGRLGLRPVSSSG